MLVARVASCELQPITRNWQLVTRNSQPMTEIQHILARLSDREAADFWAGQQDLERFRPDVAAIRRYQRSPNACAFTAQFELRESALCPTKPNCPQRLAS